MTVAVEELRELKSDQVVDARATSCPGPILAAKKAIGQVPVGGVFWVFLGFHLIYRFYLMTEIVRQHDEKAM